MGFNKRRMESEQAAAAAKEAEVRRALGPQMLADAEHLIATWNARQEAHMPMLFSPTIGAALAARHWFLWARCPACRTINAVDLRTLDRHPDAAITSLIQWLSCRSCRPNAPFADLAHLSSRSIADEMREQHRRRVLGGWTRPSVLQSAFSVGLICMTVRFWMIGQTSFRSVFDERFSLFAEQLFGR